jgi:DNA-binding transcriptional regulator GbsR (MarR family)
MARSDFTERNRSILLSLITNGPMTTTELSDHTGFNRDNIWVHSKSLTRRGLIEKKGGKFGKYHVKNNIYENPSNSAHLLMDKVFVSGCSTGKSYISEPRLIIDLLRSFIPTQKSYISLSRERSLSKIDWSDKSLENIKRIQLFSFAIRIGAYITYSLIQSMSPKRWNPRFDGVPLAKTSGKGNDQAVEEYVKNCINPLVIFWKFRQLDTVLGGLQYNESKKSYDGLTLNPHWSRYRLDENVYNKLVNSFKEIWPDVFEFLEIMSKEAEQDLEGIIKEIEQDIKHKKSNQSKKKEGRKRIVEKNKTAI